MSNRPCNKAIQCPCADGNPYMNLTAEAPDLPVFIGHYFGKVIPPNGTQFGAITCEASGSSSVSQALADLDAEQNALDCIFNSWSGSNGGLAPPNNPLPPVPPPQNPSGVVPQEIFRNQEQRATVTCPNGAPFTYTVDAGLFSALSQAAADEAALSYARQQARFQQVCLGSVRDQYCQDDPMSAAIPATGAFKSPPTYTVTGGALPPGLTLATNGIVSGTPNTIGAFMFVVTVSDGMGETGSRPYVFTICGITNPDELPLAMPDTDYTGMFAAFGLAAPSFVLVGGNLPDGLTLAPNGAVTGHVATDAQTEEFTVAVRDGSTGLICQTDCSITVQGQKCVIVGVIASSAPYDDQQNGALAANPAGQVLVTYNNSNTGNTAAALYDQDGAFISEADLVITGIYFTANNAAIWVPGVNLWCVVIFDDYSAADILTLDASLNIVAQQLVSPSVGSGANLFAGAAYNSATGLVYFFNGAAIYVVQPANGDNALVVGEIDAQTFTGPDGGAIQEIHNGSIDEDTNTLYTAVTYQNTNACVFGAILEWDVSAAQPAISEIISAYPPAPDCSGATSTCAGVFFQDGLLYALDVFADGTNQMTVIDADSQAITATVPITAGYAWQPFAAVVFNPDTQTLFLNADRIVDNVFNALLFCLTNNTMLQVVDIVPAAAFDQWAYNPASQHVYLTDISLSPGSLTELG